MQEPIKIVPPAPGSTGTTTRIEANGALIGGVTAVSVHFRPDEIVTAEITANALVEEIWAHPFMSEASFLEAAKRYGYEVLKKPLPEATGENQ